MTKHHTVTGYTGYLLLENDYFVLQEDDYKILLDGDVMSFLLTVVESRAGFTAENNVLERGAGALGTVLLLETTDALLQENGDNLLIEGSVYPIQLTTATKRTSFYAEE